MNVASCDNYLPVINSYSAFCFALFSMTILLQLGVCISPHLPPLQAVEVEALPIWKNVYHESGIDVEEKTLFLVESHVFAGEEFENK